MSVSDNKSKTLFHCKTDNAYQMKIMSELVSNIIKTSFWEISKDGLSLHMFDQPRKTMITIELKAENFHIYNFNSDRKIYIGMNSIHFHKMLKSIKKKDNIELSIDDLNRTDLTIRTIPKDHNRITTSSIKIQTVQNIDIVNPYGYEKSIIINSNDFQKMIKDLNMIGSDKIKVTTNNGVVDFTADADGIMKRTVTFGQDTCNLFGAHSSTFSTEQLDRISKISALSDSIHIFPCTSELPLQLKSNIGSLGNISIYIKSDEIIDSENV
jgi:proliferating cell nuclear antigen PCNA